MAQLPPPPGRSDLRPGPAPQLALRPLRQPGRLHGERRQRAHRFRPVRYGVFGRYGGWYVYVSFCVVLVVCVVGGGGGDGRAGMARG